MNKHKITSDSERQWDASGFWGKENAEKQEGGGVKGQKNRERELSQIESVCLGWY